MKINAFNAKCPFEIGDVIHVNGSLRKITDIMCLHYCKSGKVEFRYEFHNIPNKYAQIEIIDVAGTEEQNA